MDAKWQQSCSIPRHNMVSRGERELRGERRGKGGRSLLATAAPFFFMYLLSVQPLSAQRIGVHVRGGVTASTPLLTDQVATPAMAQLLGATIDEEVQVTPSTALTLGCGVRAAFWPRIGLTADVDYTVSELVAEDDGGTRTLQDLGVVQGTVGLSWAVRPWLEVGGGAGLLWYLTDDAGLFAQGADTSPVAELRVGWTPAFAGGRVAVVGSAQTHRFGTPIIRAEGGQDGNVTRYGIMARVRLAEVGR
jgi:hypothetical protein